jgi:Prenyltransferase and squalene oxidase repeat
MKASDIYDMERFIAMRDKAVAEKTVGGESVTTFGAADIVSADGEIGDVRITELDSSSSNDDGDGGGMYCMPCVAVAPVDDDTGFLSFNQKALQRYVLHCAQEVEKGGLRDKPGKSRDYYHSCYALSGLSVAQSFHIGQNPPSNSSDSRTDGSSEDVDAQYLTSHVFGDVGNLLRHTSCVYNIGLEKLEYALKYFRGMSSSHNELLS